MDARPFLILDLLDLKDHHVAEVKQLSKDRFDLERMLSAATELKFTREIRKVLQKQFDEPDDEFVRFFFTEANPGTRFTASAKEQFTEFVQKALRQYINERVNNRLRSALQHESVSSKPIEDEPSVDENLTIVEEQDEGIITTPEEIEGFHIVKAIVREVVSAERVVFRDTKSYMGILLDDNNRKPICRLRFNWSQKYIGMINDDKKEDKILLDSIDDIYDYADQLKSTTLRYC